jgi:hypothetical protein
MSAMHNPAHLGEVLREYLPEELGVSEAAKRLGVTRQASSAPINGRAAIGAAHFAGQNRLEGRSTTQAVLVRANSGSTAMAMKIKSARTGQPTLRHMLIKYALAIKPAVRTVKKKAVGTKTVGAVYKAKRTTIARKKAAKKRTTSAGRRATRASRR